MIFLTGSTGYVGSYLVDTFRRTSDEHLLLFVRASSAEHAEQRLWKALQLHMDFETFLAFVRSRVSIVLGDLTGHNLGFDDPTWAWASEHTTSILHCAASLNRKSAKACLNVNLRGTLSVVRLGRDAHTHHGLRRFTDVSTVAVSGTRRDEVVLEDDAIDWDRSDYDPYGRTKKFCEHMLDELLPDVSRVVVRPATVLGDSRFAETTQFDMVRAFVILAQFPALPFDPAWKMDIVNVDYVARGAASLHLCDAPAHGVYHLSSGEDSLSYAEILDAMQASGFPRRPRTMPWMEKPFTRIVDRLSWTNKKYGVALPASLLKVFLPYLTYNTVFDNQRIVEHLGDKPAPFSDYCYGLFRFARDGDFTYPYKPWPEGVAPRPAGLDAPNAEAR